MTTFGMRWHSALTLSLLVAGCAASRTPRPTMVTAQVFIPVEETRADSATFDEALTTRSSQRVAELKSRGGQCALYGSVLETSLTEGRVTVRPFMWRVGGRLVSGQARDDGAIVIARHIDALNIGARTVEDMVWTLEHEAAHIAFRIPNDSGGDDAGALVRGCRG